MPLTPTGFSIVEESFTITNITITFAWDAPRGSGPEAIVDYYRIYITPSSLSYPSSVPVTNMSLFNLTVDYNMEYETNLTAANCAGESASTSLPSFEYGKYFLLSVSIEQGVP